MFKPDGEFDETVYLELSGDHNDKLVKSDDDPRTHIDGSYTKPKTNQKMEASSAQVLKDYRNQDIFETPKKKTENRSKKELKLRNKGNSNDNKEEISDEIFYVCRKADIGTRMIECSSCEEWFHIKCVHLTEKDVQIMNRKQEDYYCEQCKKDARESVLGLQEKHTKVKENLNRKIHDWSEELK